MVDGTMEVTTGKREAGPGGRRAGGAATRRERGRQEMRETILAEARRMLAEEGADALSMRAIARAIGYSPAALYEYFASREEIFRCIYFEGAGGLGERMVATVAALPAGVTAQDAIRAMGRTYRAFALEQPGLFRLVFGGESAPHREAPPEDGRPGFDELVAALTQGIAAGEVVDLPPDALGVACWAIVHGFVVLEMNGFVGKPLDLGPSHAGADDSNDSRAAADALFELTLDRMAYGVLVRE